VAELVPGVLFIDEANLLDMECFSYLNKALESDMAPIVIFSTNVGMCRIKGSNMKGMFGIPRDLLDRMQIIRTMPYSVDEIVRILGLRC
jgi:RuvB-like protein 1 (pontin 52)